MLPNGLAIGLAALLGVAMGPLAVLVVVPVMVLAGVICRRFDVRQILMVALLLLLASFRPNDGHGHELPPEVASSPVALVTVVGLPVAGGQSERATVEVLRVPDGEDGWVASSGRVLLFLPENVAEVSQGDELLVAWRVTGNARLDPGFRSFVRSQGADGSATAFYVRVEEHRSSWPATLTGIRRDIAASLIEVLPGDAGALASGVVTGDDSGLSAKSSNAFYRTGTSHITAVSGQNVALLLGVLGAAFRPARRWMRVAANITMMVVVWSFVLMVGLEPPALRAALVASLALGASMAGRRPDALTLLSLTVGGMALLNPAIVSGIGFWLSAAASFALCSVMPSHAIGLWGAFSATVRGVFAANIATLPIIVWGFGTWSPTSLLANVLIGPVMTVTFPAAYLLAVVAVVFPSVAYLVAWIPAFGLNLTLVIVERLAPLLGGLTLPTADPRMLLMLGIPAAVTVLATGRDGTRWVRLIRLQQEFGVVSVRALASGAAAGMVVFWLVEVIAN